MGARKSWNDGAAIVLFFNFVMGVTVILTTKALMQSFPYPTTLTLFHFGVSWSAISWARKSGHMTPPPPNALPLHPWSERFTLGVLSALSPVVANISLKANAVGYAQLAKVLVTPAVVALEFFIHSRVVPRGRLVCLVFACLGVALTTLYDATVTPRGILCALSAVPPTALYKVKVSSTLRRTGLDAMTLLAGTFPIATAVMAVSAPFIDNLSAGLDNFWVMEWAEVAQVIFALVLTGLLSPLLHWSAFLVLGRSDALGHVLIGQVKMCFLVFAAPLLFGKMATGHSLAGAALAVAAITSYAYLGLPPRSVASGSALSAIHKGEENDHELDNMLSSAEKTV